MKWRGQVPWMAGMAWMAAATLGLAGCHAGHQGDAGHAGHIGPGVMASEDADDIHAGHAPHDAHADHAPAPATHAHEDAHAHTVPADHADHTDHTAHAHHDMAGLEATAGPGYTVDDVMFMQMMMGHHAQAVTMSSLVPDRSTDAAVGRLALKISITQDDEMALMRRWLEERGQAVPTEAQMGAMQMPGMISRPQMERLEGLSGMAFDALFLELMIDHHLGAVGMVDALFASPGSMQDSELFQFASDVGSEQLDEIGVMETLLDRLDPAAVSSSSASQPRSETP